MSDRVFDLPAPGGHSRALAAAWLKLAVLALLGSGLFSILLVLSRTPGIHELIPLVDFFHTALVVHVDLSVVIWFLAFAGVFWSLNSEVRDARAERLAWVLTATGTAVIALSPFLGAGRPLLNNYVPVLQHPLFYTGGVLVLGGFLLLAVRSLVTATARVRRNSTGMSLRSCVLNWHFWPIRRRRQRNWNWSTCTRATMIPRSCTDWWTEGFAQRCACC